MTDSTSQKRRHIRYKPDKLDYALVMFRGDLPSFAPDDVALIIDESAMHGAQLVLRRTAPLKSGDRVMVKLGQLEPLLGEVAWRREIEPDLCRIGVKLLE